MKHTIYVTVDIVKPNDDRAPSRWMASYQCKELFIAGTTPTYKTRELALIYCGEWLYWAMWKRDVKPEDVSVSFVDRFPDEVN